ncbi:TIGR01620 family protein [Aliiglaciecola sp. LCG003]|uniref:YcjF family protein n=1 Tax=Aliiglaciecola sp. LCG003 TaxID=3053655 RepID=UPI002573BB0C|nr:TIGR01620 family protein [Aliiglaciecola sp. LCG003]WJG08366.1 TIGR01620 family protein [Aliiglaciecola sp. LCG003]
MTQNNNQPDGKSPSPTPSAIQSAWVLEEQTHNNSPSNDEVPNGQLSPALVLDDNVQWMDDEGALSADTGHAENLAPSSKKPNKKWFWLGLVVILLGGIELFLFTQQVLEQHDWLSAAWLLLLFAVAVMAVKQVISEWRGLRQLKRFEQQRDLAKTLINTPSIGQGEIFCNQLVSQMEVIEPEAVNQWRNTLQPHYLDSEVLGLFELHVLEKADQAALQKVTKHASACAAMIAVSPFALLDMAVVLWRNLVMLKQVSQCYGMHLSYWGRIGLVKRVFKTMLFAGAAEIVSDAGNYALGAGITGKLSTRLAQGLGAGVLTSRIGIKAMHACRPLPWVAKKPPGLSHLTQQLLSDLKKVVG